MIQDYRNTSEMLVLRGAARYRTDPKELVFTLLAQKLELKTYQYIAFMGSDGKKKLSKRGKKGD